MPPILVRALQHHLPALPGPALPVVAAGRGVLLGATLALGARALFRARAPAAAPPASAPPASAQQEATVVTPSAMRRVRDGEHAGR